MYSTATLFMDVLTIINHLLPSGASVLSFVYLFLHAGRNATK